VVTFKAHVNYQPSSRWSVKNAWHPIMLIRMVMI